MTNASDNNGLLQDVINGIMEADIDPAERERLLRKIEQEGGVISDEFRHELVALFEGEAADAREARVATEEFLAAPKQAIVDDPVASSAIADVLSDQQQVTASLAAQLTAMREDVLTMERRTSQVQEGEKRRGEEDAIAKLRRDLQV